MKQLSLSIIWLTVVTAVCATNGPAVDKPVADGRLLVEKYGCTTCHAASETQALWLSPKAAPKLKDIGNRASAEWLNHYLASPNETMPGTTMPDVLNSLPAAERSAAAEAITQFLLSGHPPEFKRVMPDRAAVARGENLYHRVGCVACHAPRKGDAKVVSAVPLPNMAEKWSFEGLRRFLIDPLTCRPSGRMPAMRLSDSEAADVAHFLLRQTRVPAAVELATYRGWIKSLDEIDTADLARTERADGFAVDAKLWERRGALRFTSWLRIDQAGDYTFYFTAAGAGRFAVDQKWLAGEDSWENEKVDAKIAIHLDAGWHELKADYVHRGDRPPMMKLEWERPGVARGTIPASRLRSERDAAPELTPFVADVAKIAAGRALYEKLNCVVCHDAKAAKSAAPALAVLHDTQGCLADSPPPAAADFHLDRTRREALVAAIHFLNRADLAEPTPQQRVTNTLATFNCIACHTRDGIGGVTADRDAFFTSNVADTGDEGRLPPCLDGVGDKLQATWLDDVLTQGGSVRPYLDTRMPQFGKENIGHLPALLAAIDRNPQKLAPVADDPAVQREAGRKIVGTDGLSCIVCHRFNSQPAQTFQAVDLITAPTRLNEDWFRRFLLDPNHYHPSTRMPAFWPDGKSLLPTVLDGDTSRQHAAMWTYLSDGSRAKFPQGLSRQNLELVVGGEAVAYRGKLWEAGFRAVAVGYPGQVNAAFDAEEMRLSLIWRGRFLNAGPHWEIQGMGQIRPLGNDVIVFPHGSPLALLADANAPWPVETSKALGMKFRGYQLDEIRRPTLLYSFGATGIEDFLVPIEDKGKTGFRRTVKFTDPPPDNLYFRLAVGKLTAGGENNWRLNDALTLTIKGGGKPFVRGKGDLQELLVPVRLPEKNRQMEVEYVW